MLLFLFSGEERQREDIFERFALSVTSLFLGLYSQTPQADHTADVKLLLLLLHQVIYVIAWARLSLAKMVRFTKVPPSSFRWFNSPSPA